MHTKILLNQTSSGKSTSCLLSKYNLFTASRARDIHYLGQSLELIRAHFCVIKLHVIEANSLVRKIKFDVQRTMQ